MKWGHSVVIMKPEKAVQKVTSHIGDKGCWVFDRGADNEILKNFFVQQCSRAIIRLKRNTKVQHNGELIPVSTLAQKINFSISQKVIKVKKDKLVSESYDIGAIPITHKIGQQTHQLWLVVSRNKKHGGYCYLLTKSHLTTSIEVAKWAFGGYALRWKIEEYHRHIKQEYRLEDIQIKTFNGIQSMLVILTASMYMIYRKLKSIHIYLLLDSGYNYLNKNKPRELVNFIYYKVSKIVAILLMPVKSRWKIENTAPNPSPGQLELRFN